MKTEQIPQSHAEWNQFWLDKLRQEVLARNYSKETLKNYLLSLRVFLAFQPGHPKQRSPGDIRKFLDKLRNEDGFSASTVNLYRDGLAFFYQAVAKKPSFLEGIPRLKENQILPDVLDAAKIESLIDKLSNPKHRMALSLAYGCGFRVGELAALKLDAIDFSRKVILVRKGEGIQRQDGDVTGEHDPAYSVIC